MVLSDGWLFVPCPHCSQFQWLKFERLRWEKERPEAAAYHWEGCNCAIAEHHKTALLEAGKWHATATAADPVTYHRCALFFADWLAQLGAGREGMGARMRIPGSDARECRIIRY